MRNNACFVKNFHLIEESRCIEKGNIAVGGQLSLEPSETQFGSQRRAGQDKRGSRRRWPLKWALKDEEGSKGQNIPDKEDSKVCLECRQGAVC